MPSLPDELFSLLENRTLQARETAEKAARNILAYLKVENNTWWGNKEDPQRNLWLALRARARQLGYSVEENGEKDPVKRGLPLLVEEIAYEQWHRMLFARFLAENHLLMHSSGVAVSLAECEELAPEEGEDDAWRLAARYAGVMLPGIFRQEDPCAQVRLTPSDHHALESILLEIPPLVFTCDDALGWMYQFWQSKKKDEVNKSERKIGGADISPVTQLFTEDYMVRFLLENSLGAWWAARHPESSLIKEWEYLSFKEDGSPAAGTFPGWPKRAAEVTVMDPCCGSGHFLVAAFDMVRRMRMEEEGIDSPTAAYRTLQENIFGLEIDQRCTQIAWFALSLVGWKNGGYQPLPELNIACTGIPVKGQLEDWLALAGDDSRVKAGLERLYNLFKDAPDLGSLINPADVPLVDRMFVADFEQTIPVFRKAIAIEQSLKDNPDEPISFAANSLLKAAHLLTGKFILIVTNVPYLLRRKQSSFLRGFLESVFPDAKNDLATCFLERCKSYSDALGTYALVLPHNWTIQGTDKNLRIKWLKSQAFNFIAKLGTGAFRTISGEVVNVSLYIITNDIPNEDTEIGNIDASKIAPFTNKRQTLITSNPKLFSQKKQLSNPDSRIILEQLDEDDLLSKYASSIQGIVTGDDGHYKRCFWEMPQLYSGWIFIAGTTDKTKDFGGREQIVYWESKGRNLARPQGMKAWNHRGVLVNRMGKLDCSLYDGEAFDINVASIVPFDEGHLPAIWEFCRSQEFNQHVRKIDSKLNVTNATLVKVPFNLAKWQSLAEDRKVFPKPYSFEPVEWLFTGEITSSKEPLQTALISLLGYKWPKQNSNLIYRITDMDGITCLPAVNGESPAAERLRALLAAAYGSEWSGTKQEELLAAVGYSGKDLADWLRDGFFEQHCKLFQNRPFIWHIWDGHKDGFSALVNYHKLDRANLEKLTYTYLGAWITDRKKEMDRGVAGAEGRLLSAQALQDKLKLILAGEPPYDIYMRWKPLHEQPIGWEPDLNDGVRLNIRPFVTAGVLRCKFTINWNKDRGKNLDGSERLNDLHFTVAEKQAARKKQHVSK